MLTRISFDLSYGSRNSRLTVSKNDARSEAPIVAAPLHHRVEGRRHKTGLAEVPDVQLYVCALDTTQRVESVGSHQSNQRRSW
jgi:hypothetical protein